MFAQCVLVVKICEKVEMEVNLKRDGKRGEGRIPVRSRSPEVWKGGALNTAQHHFYCTSFSVEVISSLLTLYNLSHSQMSLFRHTNDMLHWEHQN